MPEGAQVGTVDRFQGQEAAIVLISMATSSGDDLPRQIEFLYSRNRLNVAISRARCLAVIVASPRLLETSCSTIEQLRLVNALCWAKNFGRPPVSVREARLPTASNEGPRTSQIGSHDCRRLFFVYNLHC